MSFEGRKREQGRMPEAAKYPHRLSGKILTLPVDELLLQLPCATLDEPMIHSAISRTPRMRKLMIEHGGIALAAPQVNLQWRVFWTKLSDLPVVINPAITRVSAEFQEETSESCLSEKGYVYRVRVPKEIELMYFDGQHMKKRLFNGYYAQVVWHEMKHLDGKIPSRSVDVAD